MSMIEIYHIKTGEVRKCLDGGPFAQAICKGQNQANEAAGTPWRWRVVNEPATPACLWGKQHNGPSHCSTRQRQACTRFSPACALPAPACPDIDDDPAVDLLLEKVRRFGKHADTLILVNGAPVARINSDSRLVERGDGFHNIAASPACTCEHGHTTPARYHDDTCAVKQYAAK